jgi:hypothetical protein
MDVRPARLIALTLDHLKRNGTEDLSVSLSCPEK